LFNPELETPADIMKAPMIKKTALLPKKEYTCASPKTLNVARSPITIRLVIARGIILVTHKKLANRKIINA